MDERPQAWPHEPWDQMAHNRLVVNTAELERQLIRARGASLAVGQQVAELRAERDRLAAENAQLRTLLPTARCDCGHARTWHRSMGDHDECIECPCTELRFGEDGHA